MSTEETTKYYLFYSTGEMMNEEPLEAKDAICHLLGHDGHRWKISKGDDGLWHLFVSQNSKHTPRGAGKLLHWPTYSFSWTREGVIEAVVNQGGIAGAYALTEWEYANRRLRDAADDLEDADTQDQISRIIEPLLPKGHGGLTYGESAKKLREDDPESELAELLERAERRWYELEPGFAYDR